MYRVERRILRRELSMKFDLGVRLPGLTRAVGVPLTRRAAVGRPESPAGFLSVFGCGWG